MPRGCNWTTLRLHLLDDVDGVTDKSIQEFIDKLMQELPDELVLELSDNGGFPDNA